MDQGYWRELIAPVVAGRKIVLTGNPVRGQTALAKEVRELGAADVFILGEGMGTGVDPDCAYVVLDVTGANILEALRAGQRLLADLPAEARAALDRFDPDGHALIIGSFLNEIPEVAGRPCLMYRRPEWVALEDKTVIDELWDAVGVDRVPARVVAVDALAPETGTVWSGDAREGFHGGAELTRWIRTEDDAADAFETMRAHCDRVRVMPFLEGIPCSIHAFVFPDFVAALRPCEMVVLRRGSEFFYAGAATYWDPPDGDRAQMRDVAKRVGAELRRRVGYAGAFTVDGVMTEDGFRPTELNPRQGAGLGVIARGARGLPLDLLDQTLKAGLDLEYRADEFERLIVDTADACRSGGTWKALETTLLHTTTPLVWKDARWRAATDDEVSDATALTGPSTVGGFARCGFEPARTPAGPSIARRAAAFYAYLDAEHGTGIGPLTPAHDVRQA
jgi:hypothetical protein